MASLGIIAGLLLSPTLWLSSRNYPLTPVFPLLQAVPPPFDAVVFGVLLLLLAVVAVAPRASWWILAFAALAAGYTLFDQSRWQPWFYQYLFMLLAMGWMKGDAALDTCRLIVVSIYFWSGVQKMNPGFTHETFRWMAGGLPAALAFAAPVMESAIGIGLLTQRFRKLAVIAALGMHIFILASIGPFGHNHNSVVWPWNVAMGTFVVLLFWRENSGSRRIVWGRGFQLVVLMLFAVLPALSFVDLWDSYLSFALYSGNQREAVIAMSDDVAASLPDAMQELVTVYDSESRVDTLDVREWSYAELNVPPYAELRVLRNAGRRVCSFTGNPSAMVMIVDGKRSWFHARPRKLYTCAMLQR